VNDASHIREDSNVWPLPWLSLQTPLRLKLVRVFTPEDLVPIKPKPAVSVTRAGEWDVGLTGNRHNGNDHGQSPGNRDFGENLSGNRRDGVEEQQHVIVNDLLQDVERDRMELQVFLLARTTRQFVSRV